MRDRFTPDDLEAWRREGAVVMPGFFSAEEVAAVAADFELVFGDPSEQAVDDPMVRGGSFHPRQFTNNEPVPFDCSPALNLIGAHPALVAFARAALGTPDVRLYQCLAWAKFTGTADYEQPFHCDYMNHTLTAPSEVVGANSMTVLAWFSDVTEAHGATHWVTRPDSDRVAGPEATVGFETQNAVHEKLLPYARTTAGPAGSAFAYGIDVYHRGTNLTAPKGHRYAVTACYKRTGDDAIGYTAWPYHHTRPWGRIFAHATPEQLALFGVQPPGDPFWTPVTLNRAKARYPEWDLSPYEAAMA